MTAPQEPPKPTMFLLTRTTWTDSTIIGLYFDKTKARAEADRLEAAKGQGDGWQEYYVNPIGVADAPARDDAAELRAALREWAEATRAAEWFELDQTNAYGDDHIDAEYRVEVARKVLLALAATEEGS